MTRLRILWSRLRSTLLRRHADVDLQHEIDAHLDLLAAEHRRRGLSERVARAAARKDFGGVTQLADIYREQSRLSFSDWLAQDIRHAVRSLCRAPAFALITVATLAFGIGATTAVFSIVNAVLLRPLPYPGADRILALGSLVSDIRSHSGATFHYLRERTPALAAVAAYRSDTGWNLVTSLGAEYVRGLAVSANYFEAMGVAPLVGRSFTTAEDEANGPSAVVISEAIWRRHFAGAPDAIGEVVRLGGSARTIVGVMPTSFQSMPPVDVWTPLRLSSRDATRNYGVIGRLRADASAAEASAQLDAVRAEMVRDLRSVEREIQNRADLLDWLPYQTFVTQQHQRVILLLLGAVGLVLLLACANVASLHLVRATTRAREMATRMALGGNPLRVAWQVMTEPLILAVVGAAVGLLVARGALSILMPLLDASTAGYRVTLDVRVLTVAALAAVISGGFVGIWPAFEVIHADARTSMAGSGNRVSASRRPLWLRRAFVVVQLAATCVLLTGSGLFLRALIGMVGADPGFDPSGVLTAQVSIQSEGQTTDEIARFLERTVEHVRTLPGVEAAAVASNVPVERGLNLPIEALGQIDQMRSVEWRYVSEQYFDALRIPLDDGRVFDRLDVLGGSPVAVVNGAFARAYFGEQRTVGQSLQLVRALAGDPPRQIVGVVGDVRSASGAGWTSGPALASPAPPTVYFPLAQVSSRLLPIIHRSGPVHFVIRASGAEGHLIPALQQAIRSAAPEVPVIQVRTMTDVMARATQPPRAMLRVLGAFAIGALLLAVTGLYALIAYGVAARTREIGIRLAVGATPVHVAGRFVREGVLLAAAGLTVGLAVAASLSRALEFLVFTYGINRLDSLTSIAVTLGLLLAALLASVVPARRAARVDPMIALRAE